MEFKDLFKYREVVAFYSIVLVALVAGITKFTHPEIWLGYKPGWPILSLITDIQFVYLGGVVQTATGLLLLAKWRTYQVATVIMLWLLGVTLVVASNGLWLQAFRNMVIMAFTYTVIAQEYSRHVRNGSS